MAGEGVTGLFEGLAKGLGTGFQLGQRNRLLEIQEKQAAIEETAQFSQRLIDFSKMDPELRKHVGPSFFKNFEKAFGTTLDDTVKKSLVEGDKFAPAIYAYVADSMKKGMKWQDIVNGLTAKEGDWQKKIDIFEKVYSKFYQPEEKLTLERRQTAATESQAASAAANAATARMNAETTRAVHGKEIVASEIFKELNTTIKEGGTLNDQQLSRARLAGLSLGLKADESFNMQINADVPALGLKKGQIVIGLRDKSNGALFMTHPETGKPVQIPSTLGIEVGKPTEPGPKYMIMGNKVLLTDPASQQVKVVYEGSKELQSVHTDSQGRLIGAFKDGSTTVIEGTPGTYTQSKDAVVRQKGTNAVIAEAPGAQEPKTWTLNSTYQDPKSGITIGKGERATGVPSRDGKTVTFSVPDGKGGRTDVDIPTSLLVGTTVQTGAAAPEGTEARTKLQNQIDAAELGIKDAVALQKLVQGGMKTGTAATWQRFLQSSVGQAKQFTELLNSVRKDAIRGDKFDAQYSAFFDPRLPTSQLLENAVTYRLATVLSPGNERVPLEMLRQVAKNVGFSEGWANDPRTASAKMAEVIRQLSQTRSLLSKRRQEDTSSPFKQPPDFDATKK